MATGLASIIADRLFINGHGDQAKRLVLELETGKNGGGWCKAAVVSVIEQALKETADAK